MVSGLNIAKGSYTLAIFFAIALQGTYLAMPIDLMNETFMPGSGVLFLFRTPFPLRLEAYV